MHQSRTENVKTFWVGKYSWWVYLKGLDHIHFLNFFEPFSKKLFYINSIYNQNKRFRKQSQYNKIILISRNTFAKPKYSNGVLLLFTF